MNFHNEGYQFSEDELGCASIDSFGELGQPRLGEDGVLIPPFPDGLIEALEAVLVVDFVVEGEPSLRVANSFFLLGSEEQFQHVDHTAGIEDCAVFGEELSADFGKELLVSLAGASPCLSLSYQITHYTITPSRNNKIVSHPFLSVVSPFHNHAFAVG